MCQVWSCRGRKEGRFKTGKEELEAVTRSYRSTYNYLYLCCLIKEVWRAKWVCNSGWENAGRKAGSACSACALLSFLW